MPRKIGGTRPTLGPANLIPACLSPLIFHSIPSHRGRRPALSTGRGCGAVAAKGSDAPDAPSQGPSRAASAKRPGEKQALEGAGGLGRKVDVPGPHGASLSSARGAPRRHLFPFRGPHRTGTRCPEGRPAPLDFRPRARIRRRGCRAVRERSTPDAAPELVCGTPRTAFGEGRISIRISRKGKRDRCLWVTQRMAF